MDAQTTFDVKVWKIAPYRGKRRTTYTVRWALNGKEYRDVYATVALADSFRSSLISAMGNGEAFNLETGLPASHRTKAAALNWYDFAVKYVDSAWSRTSAHQRKNVAASFVPVTVALLRTSPTSFTDKDLRAALRHWGFNARRRSEAPQDVALILKWVQRNVRPMTAWEDGAMVRDVLDAISTKLDGKPAAGGTAK